MAQKRGRSNLESVFKLKQLPSDTHTRNMLDGVSASHLDGAYEWLWNQLEKENELARFQIMGGRLLVGFDGIQFGRVCNAKKSVGGR